MKNIFTSKKLVKLSAKTIASLAFVFALNINSNAQVTAAQSGNWSATTTWVGGVVPVATDNVLIGGAFTVTIDGVDSCTGLTLGDGASNGTLMFHVNDSLSLSGALTVGNGASTGNIDMTNGGVLNLTSYTAPAAGTWIPGAGTVSYNFSMALSIYVLPNNFFDSYNNLTINAVSSSIIRTNLGISVINSLNLLSGTFDMNGFDLTVGDVRGTGSITDMSATPVTLTTGGDIASTTLSGIISSSITLVKNGTGVLTLTGANTYTGGTILNTGQLDIDNNTALGTGSFTINAGAIDNNSGSNVTLSNNNTQIWNNSFTYVGTDSLNMGTGTITLGTDIVITASGVGAITEGGAINDMVNSLYTNGGGTVYLASQAIQLNNFGLLSAGTFNAKNASISLAGNFTDNGAFNGGTGSVVFNGTSSQNIHGSKSSIFYNLTLNNSTGLYLNQTVNINNQLALTAGQITLGIDSLTIGSGGSISGANSSNYIVTNSTGTLNKIFSGTGSFTFEVGDNVAATDYTPVNVFIFSGSFPATLNVATVPQKDPHNNSPVNYLSRFWNINQTGLGVFSALVTATYLPADVAGTEASIAGALWPNTFPWVKNSAVNTTTHVISENVSSFGDISGVTLAPPIVNITPTTVCIASNTITATATGDPTLTYLWSTGESTSAINPTASGNYTVTVTDGNGFTTTQNQAITVNAASLQLSSNLGTDVQAVCVNTPIVNISYTVGGGSTGTTISALPAGVTSSFSAGMLTISGTPTLGGTYTYTVTSTGNPCNVETTASGTIEVTSPSIILSSAAGTDAQSACLNNALTNITYNIGGTATGATIAGLPTGINYSFNGGVLTISGTPTVSGVSTYTVSTSGGSCGTLTATGSISVGSLSLALTSAVGSDAQTVCYNALVDNITYAAGGSATSATVTGLPNGVNSAFSGGTVTISGRPATGGIYTYTVTAIGGECAPTAIGTITVNQPIVNLISQAGTDNQLICQGTSIINIKYAINSTATGATVSGLPIGVNYLYNNDTLLISGAPSDSGLFNYTVFTSGSPCGVGTATGIIQISSPYASLSSSFGTDAQAVCAGTTLTNITYDIGGLATGATVSGLPTGVSYAYNTGLLTISGTPTLGGTYSYIVTTTGGLCNPATASGNITVNAPILTLASAPHTDNQSVCANTAIANIVYAYGGTTIGTSISGLPNGLSTASINDTLVISGTPTDTGSFTYTINTIGTSCSSIMVTGTITINTPALSLSSGVNTDNQTLCGDTHMANITYDVTGGSTGASVAGLPSGVNFSYISGIITISGTPSNGGTFPYIVSTTGGTCGSAVANGSISVNVTPTVTIKGSAGQRAGTSDTLIASGAVSYVWLNNGVLNDSDIVNPVANTIYTVVGTSAQGCSDTARFFVTINTVGVNELSTSTTISLYPNPVLDVLNLSFDVVGTEKNATIKVIDITGKEIAISQTSISNGKTVSFDVSSFAQGMYFVKVITPNNSQVLKFMKQ